MMAQHLRHRGALLVSAALLASLAAATVAAPASAAKPTCAGKTATIVGTARGEVIKGTEKADVIVARGGHDIIYGRGGNDTICGGPGNDRILGAGGNDLLFGQTGRDKLFGGAGRDRLLGGPADDRLAGGPGNDACLQGSGNGPRVGCERPALVPPPGPTLIPLTGILAIAYSDIDGLDGYSTGDVMIAQLVDTDPGGIPSPGDTIEMGRYPTNFAWTTFGDWGKSHVVASISGQDATQLVVMSTGGGIHQWIRDSMREQYYEQIGPTTFFMDGLDGAFQDSLQVDTSSPSLPKTSVVPQFSGPNTINDAFIDVLLAY